MLYNWKTKSDSQIAKLVIENQGRFEKKRSVYDDLWNLIVKVFRPRRYDILQNQSRDKGEQYGAKIYDQDPANALSKFASGKLGYMVNRAVPWIQFITPDASLMELDHVKQYLQESAEQVLYAAGRSNLYSALSPHILDSDSIGTSVMVPMLDEVKDRVVFDVVHPKNSYIATNKFGDVEVYHRPMQITRMTALDMFGKDKLPDIWFGENGELKEILQEDEYLWCVYPNSDRDNSSLLSTDKKYLTLCVLRDGPATEKKPKLVYKSGRDYFPISNRSMRESGAEYGTSIASDCLTSALVSTKLGEKGIQAAHLAVDPAKIASKSIRPSLRTNPGSTTWVDDIQREGVKTWMERLNWPITDAQMDRLHKQIEDRMFIRFFEMLSAGDIKARTAYEVSQMMSEKATLMSSVIDTFEQETLEPAITILIEEETLAGRMPDPPDEIIMSGGRVDIRYLGPLAQMQRSLLRSRGTIDALSIIQQMITMSQEVGWVFNWREMAEDVAIAQGMPQKFVHSKELQEELMAGAAQAQEETRQAQMIEMMGKAAPGMAKAPEKGSPTDMMMAEVA